MGSVQLGQVGNAPGWAPGLRHWERAVHDSPWLLRAALRAAGCHLGKPSEAQSSSCALYRLGTPKALSRTMAGMSGVPNGFAYGDGWIDIFVHFGTTKTLK